MKNKLVIFIVAVFIICFSINQIAYAETYENMKAYYIIDNEGYYIEQVFLIKQQGVDYSKYIEIAPIGFIKPKWNGNEWVEKYISPVIKTNRTNNIQETDQIIEPEEVIPPSLTASTLMLSPLSTFDINLVDKDTDEDVTYSWTSSDEKVATVNKIGVVSSKSKGEAEITCNIKTKTSSYKLSANVIVGDNNSDIELSDSELDLEVGDKFDIDVENTSVKSKIKWTTSDKSVITVKSSTGKVTAINNGKAVIYCTISKNKQIIVLKCDVSVSK